jgi:hypothetical protein
MFYEHMLVVEWTGIRRKKILAWREEEGLERWERTRRSGAAENVDRGEGFLGQIDRAEKSTIPHGGGCVPCVVVEGMTVFRTK